MQASQSYRKAIMFKPEQVTRITAFKNIVNILIKFMPSPDSVPSNCRSRVDTFKKRAELQSQQMFTEIDLPR